MIFLWMGAWDLDAEEKSKKSEKSKMTEKGKVAEKSK